MIVPHRPSPAAPRPPETTGGAGLVGHHAQVIGEVVIRDGGPDDVPRMVWASSDGLRAQRLAQAHRAATGEANFLVAEYAGKVVGKLVVDWVHNPDGSAWLWMGSIDPAYRGQGIGQRALAAAEDRARQRLPRGRDVRGQRQPSRQGPLPAQRLHDGRAAPRRARRDRTRRQPRTSGIARRAAPHVAVILTGVLRAGQRLGAPPRCDGQDGAVQQPRQRVGAGQPVAPV
jgi:ribosomal protein S18 acetylase RimI-like enzyme